MQRSFTTLPAFATYSTDTVFGKFLGYSGTTYDHYVKKGSNGKSVVGPTPAEIEKKVNDRILEELGKYSVSKTIYLGDIPGSMRGAIENVFLDLGRYIGDLPGLIQKHNSNLINAGVPQSVINNMWRTIDTIWANNEGLDSPSSITIAATVFVVWEYGVIAVTPVVDGAGNVLTTLVTGPVVNGYTYYQASLLAALGIGKAGPAIVRLLPAEETEIQLLTQTPNLISKINSAGNIYGKVRDSVNRLVWVAKGNIATVNQAGSGLDHIMLELRAGDTMTRFQQIINNKVFMDWMTKNWGYSVQKPADMIRLMEDVVTKGKQISDGYQVPYLGEKVIKVVVAPNGYITTVTFK